ncbi:MAG: ankyrin repeat domain-containing protein [Bacteroidota bacterium]
MKKTAIIIAIAFGFSMTSLNATNEVTNDNNFEVVAKVKVSPFCMAIVKGDIETVKKLIDLGTDVNEKSNGMTPAMYAAKFNRVDILKVLVDHGAKLKVKSDKGMTVAKLAKLSNATDVVTYINGLKS